MDALPEARIGLLGKHPGYGDFVQAGISAPVVDGLSGWIDSTLASLRDTLGNDWQAFWDSAQDLRFWIGRAVLGRTLAGVFRPSRDRVGRRYPLVLMAEGAAVPCPLADPDQAFYDRLAAHLQAMQPGQGGAALLQGLPPVLIGEDAMTAATGPTLWAHRLDGDVAALLQAAAPVDAERATLARSFWWAPGTGGRAAVWLGAPGLPTAAALHWLLAGIPTDPENAYGG